jgi:hypothetical protein
MGAGAIAAASAPPQVTQNAAAGRFNAPHFAQEITAAG